MKRSTMAVMAFALALVAILGDQVRAVQPVYDIEWIDQVDNSGDWNDAGAWKNLFTGATGNSATLMGSTQNFEGMNTINPTTTRARNIIIGGGDTVNFNVAVAGNTFRQRQGMTLTIKDGATWVQDADVVPDGNGWFECRCDMSELTLDGGTFKRTGTGTDNVGTPEVPVYENVGGGNMLLASYNDDNNQARLSGGLPPTVKVNLKNGGRIENEGQLWFGTDGESSPNTRVHMTINDGDLDLTGGEFNIDNGEASTDEGGPGVIADLAFFYDWSESLTFGNPLKKHNEEYVVNFTGPGSITVDQSGIQIYEQPAPADLGDPGTASTWTETQASYLDLWNRGILRANGLSGKTGTVFGDGAGGIVMTPANFDDFFTVTNNPGDPDYKLEAKPATTLATAEWQGGSGGWNDANKWKNLTTAATGDATAILLGKRGSEGMNNLNPALTAARHIVIGNGATVDYNPLTDNSGFRFRQGTTITIQDGATLVQDITGDPDGNGWWECRCDMSELNIDGGTFKRVGTGTDNVGTPEVPVYENVGGGNMLLASYNDDNNQARLSGGLPPTVKVNITNGGRLENEGQLWFGTDGESSPNTRVHMTINDGYLDLTGGQFNIDNGEASTDEGGPGVIADLAFFYDWSESLTFGNPLKKHNEEYVINFTGPGSITVDESAIQLYEQPAPADLGDPGTASTWTETQVSYQDLWNMGILRANGLSGKTGTVFGDGAGGIVMTPANFNDFFTVTNNPGDANYILNSLIEANPEEDADYNEDGTIDAADWVAGKKLGLDLGLWQQQFGQSSPGAGGSGGGGVPEPGTMMLMLLGFASVSVFKKRSR